MGWTKIYCWLCCGSICINYITYISSLLKGRSKWWSIVAETELRPGSKNVFTKFQKHFLLSWYRFCVFSICFLRAQTKKHLDNNEEKMTPNLSSFTYPRNISRNICRRRRVCVSEAKNVLLSSRLLTQVTLWATLTQNVSAVMFSCLHRP